MKKKVKALIGRMAGLTGAYARGFRSKMTIVTFHRVNDHMESDGLTCSSAKFEAFCEFFEQYFRVVPLSEQVAACRSGQNTGGTLSITFDDGYLDNFEVAAPILRKFQLSACFFVVTAFIGTKIVAPWDQSSPLSGGWMSWDQVRALASQGFEIGSHTHNHINLGSADPESVRIDLHASKEMLHQELGGLAKLFAYPFGGRNDISERSRELIRESGFECCVSCFGGVNPISANPYYLKRIAIAEWFASPDQFGFELVKTGADEA